jgi:hypothetical protein
MKLAGRERAWLFKVFITVSRMVELCLVTCNNLFLTTSVIIIIYEAI